LILPLIQGLKLPVSPLVLLYPKKTPLTLSIELYI